MNYELFRQNKLVGVKSEDGKVLIEPTENNIDFHDNYIATKNKVFILINGEMVLIPNIFNCRQFGPKNIFILTDGYHHETLAYVKDNSTLEKIYTNPKVGGTIECEVDAKKDVGFLNYKNENDNSLSVYDFINHKYIIQGLKGYSSSENFFTNASKKVKGMEYFFLVNDYKKYNILYKGKLLFSHDYNHISTIYLSLCDDDSWLIQIQNSNNEIAFYDLKHGEFKSSFSGDKYKVLPSSECLLNLTSKQILDNKCNVLETFDEFVSGQYPTTPSFFCIRKGNTFYFYKNKMELFYKKDNVTSIEKVSLEYFKSIESEATGEVISKFLALIKVKRESFLIDLDGKNVVDKKLSSVYNDEIQRDLILVSFDRKPIVLKFTENDGVFEISLLEISDSISSENIISLLKYCVWSVDEAIAFLKSIGNNYAFLSCQKLIFGALVENNFFTKEELDKIKSEIPNFTKKDKKDLGNINNIVDKYPRKMLKPICEYSMTLDSILFNIWK